MIVSAITNSSQTPTSLKVSTNFIYIRNRTINKKNNLKSCLK